MRAYRQILIVAAVALILPATEFMQPAFAAQAKTSSTVARLRRHHVVFQVDSDDPTVMKHAISGSINATRYYAEQNEPVAIEIVANATGLKIFRTDTSPVKDGLAILRAMKPDIVFSVCGSTKRIMEAQEGHPLSLIDGVRVVPLGVGRIIELEEAGWSYIHA